MVIEFFGYLGSIVHDANRWEISLALCRWKREAYSGARESVCVRIVPLLLRSLDPSPAFPYVYIVHDNYRTSKER